MLDDKKNIWILSGETSGDVYGAELAKELISISSTEIKISGMGGENMRKAGVNILVDSTELGVVGLVEVFKNIFKFIAIFRFLLKKAEEELPDAVILIDYPGFNLRFAKQLHKRNIKVIWYVSPQVWVWGKKRIYKLAKYCNKMLVIFPFEVDVYKKTNLDVEFVGHPLVDIVKKKLDPNIVRDPNKLLLLPGSRSCEIERLLIPMLQTAILLKENHPNLLIKISAARKSIETKILGIIHSFEKKYNLKINATIECGNNLKLLQECGTGLCKSGTVTVESSIVGIPLVVVYKLNPITLFLAKVIIRKLFRNAFAMPNIIANKIIYEEYLQDAVNPSNLSRAIEKVMPKGERREVVIRELDYLTNNLLTCGKKNASKNAAESIFRAISK